MKLGKYFVFHDESEPTPNKGMLLIGLLFVPTHKEESVLALLERARKREGYWGEIHFCSLPKGFGGEYGAKARVAREWLRFYENGLYEDAMFSCLVVNRASPSFEHHRFSQDYHAYNRFTAMAIKAAIAWLLQPEGFDTLSLTLVSDEKDRKSRPDQDGADNFESYIPYKVTLDTHIARELKGKPYPTVKMEPIQLVQSCKHDLLQLTDLFLGAIQCALVNIAKRPTKRELAKRVLRWCKDLERKPWEQSYNMHRKFTVWGFPNAQGKPFNCLSWAMETNDEAM